MSYLTEKQAWEKIAQAFDRLAETGKTFEVEAETRVVVHAGMCHAVWCLYTSNLVDYETRFAMETTLYQHDQDAREASAYARDTWYWWPTADAQAEASDKGREGAANRAMFAQLMAEVIE